MWKEAIMVVGTGRTEENYEQLQYPVEDFNPYPLRHKPGVLNTAMVFINSLL